MNQNVLVIFGMGIAGVIAHCLCKIISLQKDARTGGVDFEWKRDYLALDKYSIILSFLSVAVWYFIYNEAEGVYNKLSAWKATSFFIAGFFGSYAIQYGKTKGEKKIRNVIDVKTNVADQVTGGTGTVTDTIQKAGDQGIDVAPTPKK